MLKRLIWIYLFISLTFSGSLMAQNHKLGDLVFNTNDGTQGVVFWLSPDANYGWMVAMKDLSIDEGHAVRNRFTWWSMAGVNIAGIPDIRSPLGDADPARTDAMASYDTSGYDHTRVMMQSYLPTDLNCVWRYVDFSNGWFVPSAGQAQILSLAPAFIDATLTQNGGTVVGGAYYWTSSEYDHNNAPDFYPGSGVIVSSNNNPKVDMHPVRLIRHFFNKQVGTDLSDTTLHYVWNTGQEALQIEVQPSQNTVYSATVTTAIGCERQVSKQIYVSSVDQQEIYDSTCIGKPYQQKGFAIDAQRIPNPGSHVFDTLLLSGSCQVPLRLYLQIHDTASSRLDSSLCEGASMICNGVVYTDTGTYIQRLASFQHCDSILRIHLKRKPSFQTYLVAQDTVYHSWNGIDYMASGTYQQRYKAHNGCDSTVTLDLTIVDVYLDTVFRIDTIYDTLGVCQGTLPILYQGQNISRFGDHELVPNDSTLIFLQVKAHPIYDMTLNLDSCSRVSLIGCNFINDTAFKLIYQSSLGCDSTIRVAIRVRKPSVNHVFLDSCDRITVDGHSYDRDTVLHRIYLNSQGCDSLVNIRLTVMLSANQSLDIHACDSVNYRNQWYRDSIQVVDQLSGSTCSTTITANLHIARSSDVYLSFDQCDSITYAQRTYTRDTVLYRYHLNQASCDSTTEVHLHIRKGSSSSETIDSCGSVTYGAQQYFRDTVLWAYALNMLGCDSSHMVDIKVRQPSFSEQRIDSNFRVIYQDIEYDHDTVIEEYHLNVMGCDSVHRVLLSVNRDGLDSSQIVVYWGKVLALSNPSNLEVLKTATYQWYRDGQVLPSNRSYVEVGAPIPAGTYRVEARWEQGQVIAERTFEQALSPMIYPNPAPKGTTLTLSTSKALRQIEVYHNDGRLLFRIPQVSQIPPQFEAPMLAGVYLVVLSFEDHSRETHKIVVR